MSTTGPERPDPTDTSRAELRILLLSHYYAPEIGAPQRRWDALISRFVHLGARVAVIAPSPHYPDGRLLPEHEALGPGTLGRGRHGEAVYRARFRAYGHGVSGRGLDQVVTALDTIRIGLSQFARHRPDVIVSTVPAVPTAVAGLALGAALRRPVVLEMRDAWPDLIRYRDQWDDDSTPLRGLALDMTDRLLSWAQRRSAAVVTLTASFGRRLTSRRIAPVHVIRNGTSQSALPPAAHRDGPLRILYLGTVGRSQDISTAVRAVALLRERGVAVHLRIVGSGAMRSSVQRLAQDLEAPVEFLDSVPSASTGAHYEWCDTVLVSLQNWRPMHWTVPSKLVEALATGRHVSGVLAGEAAGIVRQTSAGSVVHPGNVTELAELWANLTADRSRLRVGGGGVDWVRQHADEDALASRYLDALRGVVR